MAENSFLLPKNLCLIDSADKSRILWESCSLFDGSTGPIRILNLLIQLTSDLKSGLKKRSVLIISSPSKSFSLSAAFHN